MDVVALAWEKEDAVSSRCAHQVVYVSQECSCAVLYGVVWLVGGGMCDVFLSGCTVQQVLHLT